MRPRSLTRTRAFWDNLAPRKLDGFGRHLLSTLVLFTAYADILQHGEQGFFSVLLKSPLVGMIKTSIREKWEAKFVIQGEWDDEGEEVTAAQQLSVWIPPQVVPRQDRAVQKRAKENEQRAKTSNGQKEDLEAQSPKPDTLRRKLSIHGRNSAG